MSVDICQAVLILLFSAIMQKTLAKKNNEGYIPLCSVLVNGCVAQVVEQLTLNQWVWGSNPHAPTIGKSRVYIMCPAFIFLVI